MGGGSSTEEKMEEPMTDSSTQMMEILSGFHVLEIHMLSMGTSMGLLLVVGPAAARQEAVADGGLPLPGAAFRDGLPVPRQPSLLPAAAARRPVLDTWGEGSRGPLRGAALGAGCPTLSPLTAPLRPWAGSTVAPVDDEDLECC